MSLILGGKDWVGPGSARPRIVVGSFPNKNDELKKIRESRGYNYMDLLELSPGEVENYEEKLKRFYQEHIHADEEIHYCLEGSGLFAVWDKEDHWLRIWIKGT